MKFKFNDIANAISVVSGVSLAGIIGVGSYVYFNKDAIIEDIKEAAIESVVGGMGAGALGGAAGSLGSPDLLPSPSPDQAAAPSAPDFGLPQ
tara:strand:+ start:135 stop:410 length:276 start_codon:yes stop_codon:yes gene_type:complete